MKTWLLALVLGMLLSPAASAEKIDCQTMAELGSGLDDIRTGLENGEDVDGETYADLADVIDILRVVAAEEGNRKLDRALDDLENAHANNDRDAFVDALVDVDTVFGALYVADCD